MQPILGFYHVAMLNNWHAIMHNQINKLNKSGLLQKSEHIYTTFLGPYKQLQRLGKLPDKFHIHYEPDLALYENFTIETIKELSAKENFVCYYFHTKGVSVSDEKRYNAKSKLKEYGYTPISKVKQNVVRWRLLMDYFIIEKWQDAFDSMKDYDCAGVNWRNKPFRHFAGNYWWSKSMYLRTLQSVYDFNYESPFVEEEKVRHRAEAWIGQKPNVKVKELYNHKANYWEAPQPKEYQCTIKKSLTKSNKLNFLESSSQDHTDQEQP